MDRDAHAPAHDNAVDERHVGLAVAFDAGVERELLTKKAEHLLVVSGAPKSIEWAQAPARREGPGIVRDPEHAPDCGIRLPLCELARQLAYHGQRHRVERVRPIER